MAIKLAERYPTRASDPSLDYPTGSFKNKSAPGAVDGTPLEKDWANDFLGFRDALLDAAEIVANGDIDTAQASQTFDALTAYIAATAPQSPLQTQATWNAGASETESVISPEKLDVKIKTLSIATNQSLTDVSASRSHSVAYTNSTGKPIVVMSNTDTSSGSARDWQMSIDGSVWVKVGATGGSGDGENITFIVPNGWQYRINGSCLISSWSEIR